MPKFKFYVSTGYVGSQREEIVEIDDAELEGMTEDERADYLNEVWQDWQWNNIYGGWEEVEDGN
ncbi:hypothetical protein J27TS7_57920 [Paenibacillus dendritiformis]|uniref:DUF7167 family protein n=1 Tax=Paenibacillus dendritiformis TaxID=130049 RepID=UPI001B278A4C|nr:hypothetical protein [Paenibacillus dendritiformis]GIO76278.1 hypothetical protein J27TS7_57920 [Paenibacillus dendritiformis]